MNTRMIHHTMRVRKNITAIRTSTIFGAFIGTIGQHRSSCRASITPEGCAFSGRIGSQTSICC